MSSSFFPYRIFPLGDSAITIDYGNVIDEEINKQVIGRFRQLQQSPLPGMTEAVPAYSSLTIFYNPVHIKKMIRVLSGSFDWMKEKAEEWMQEPLVYTGANEKIIRIPVCYEKEYAPDIHSAAGQKKMPVEELIALHSWKQYRVYMLGFLPGFAYMGEVDEKISLPRKPQPVNIGAGSVGIAGRQTGIYPLASPGGWQIIGRTPLSLFNQDEPELTLLHPGDRAQFYPINKDEFEDWLRRKS